MKTLIRLVAIGILALTGITYAANPPASLTMIPAQINYQGRLVTPANAPYNDTTHSIDLTLYASASTGAKLWSERYAVQTKDGYFSVNLGSGGTGLLATNLQLWQVLWKTNAASPDTFFMALTVRTDQNGNAIANPLEATPRQQFLTAPFAYRAHQSVYASKADGTFDAPNGIQTSTLSSTNNELTVSGNLRASGTVYANAVRAQGSSPYLNLLSAGGPLRLGVNYTTIMGFPMVSEYASSIQIGARSAGLVIGGESTGTDVSIDGRTVDIGTTNLTYNSQPMFVRKSVSGTLNTSSILTEVESGIDTSDYDLNIVGWYYGANSPAVKAIFIPSQQYSAARVYFTSAPSSGSITIHFLGIRKGLTKY